MLPPAAYDTLKFAGWHQIRNFYGLPTEQFHQPCALWHSSGFYIMAAAAAGHIYVFHVGTCKVRSCLASMASCILASCLHAILLLNGSLCMGLFQVEAKTVWSTFRSHMLGYVHSIPASLPAPGSMLK